jgi:hypothetical protein
VYNRGDIVQIYNDKFYKIVFYHKEDKRIIGILLGEKNHPDKEQEFSENDIKQHWIMYKNHPKIKNI